MQRIPIKFQAFEIKRMACNQCAMSSIRIGFVASVERLGAARHMAKTYTTDRNLLTIVGSWLLCGHPVRFPSRAHQLWQKLAFGDICRKSVSAFAAIMQLAAPIRARKTTFCANKKRSKCH